MRFHFVNPSRPDGTRGLHIAAPSRRMSQQDVDQFFARCVQALERENRQRRAINSVWIKLGSADGLHQPSSFLTALCSFLRSYRYEIVNGRRNLICFYVKVQLAEDDSGNDTNNGSLALVSRSDPIVQEATDRICEAVCQNMNLRTPERVFAGPVWPSCEIPERFFATSGLYRCSVKVRVLDPSSPNDQLRLSSGSVEIEAWGAVHGKNVTMHVLREWPPGGLCVQMNSPVARGAFVEGLNEVRHHMFRNFSFVAGSQQGVIEGSDLCGAVLRCPSVKELSFEGIELAPAALVAAREALASASSAQLTSMSFRNCTFPDTAVGPVELAAAMSHNNKLNSFILSNQHLRESDIPSLCTRLSEGWDVEYLELGFDGTPAGDGQVGHFFRHLPSMTTLKFLTINCQVPARLTKTVRDGFKHNYWLCDLAGLELEAESAEERQRLNLDIAMFPVSNRRGRTAAHRAASNPDDPQLYQEALAVLRRLSRSNDLLDATVLYHCMQVFLPPRLAFIAQEEQA